MRKRFQARPRAEHGMKVAVIYSDVFLKHEPGPGHPECPERLEVMLRELERSGLLASGSCELVEPRPATDEDLALLHDPGYVRWVRELCARGGGVMDLGDTVASPGSFEAAVHAAGAAIQAVDLVLEGRYKAAFALVRPPGHHAGRDYARGFCIFNNVALAAQHLIERRGLERVAIIDIDAHHGNGTQEFFYETDRVLYASLHQDPTWFPGTGFEDEVGTLAGRGFTINIPLPFLIGDDIYLRAVEDIVAPIVEQYEPQFVLASVGFDTHYADPVARLGLSMLGHLRAFATIARLAGRCCSGRLVAVLEGGYSLTHIGKMLAADLAFLTGHDYELVDEETRTPPRLREKAEKVLREVRRIQSEFWQL
ncbi:histone deacetylase [Candidatus Bathyarchaeota archaeon]|nr:MAG: histone deacetylase [Candidatus Bathyarchaeota archaeon]